jgi:hypothetical protein
MILHWKASRLKIYPVFKRSKCVWRHVTELKHILCFSNVLQYCGGMCMVQLAVYCNMSVPKILNCFESAYRNCGTWIISGSLQGLDFGFLDVKWHDHIVSRLNLFFYNDSTYLLIQRRTSSRFLVALATEVCTVVPVFLGPQYRACFKLPGT